MKKIILIAMVSSLTTFVYAKDPQPNARDNYYTSGYIAGINFGEAIIEGDEVPGYGKDDAGFTARPYIAYAFNPYVSFEIGYLFLPKLSYRKAGSPNINLTTHGFDLLLNSKYPLGEGFALYGKLGGAILNAKHAIDQGHSDAEDATVLAYAGGLDYSFANIGGLHMTLDYYHTDDKTTSTFKIPAQHSYSIGVYYLF